MEQAEQAHNEFVDELEEVVHFLNHNCSGRFDVETEISSWTQARGIPLNAGRKLIEDTSRLLTREAMNTSIEFVEADTITPEMATLKPAIIDGILREGGLVCISADPKVGKSMLAIQMSYSIANGQMFLDMNTKKGKVLLIDAEVDKNEVDWRIMQMSEELKLPRSGITRVSLRDRIYNIEQLHDELVKSGRSGQYSLIIIDAFYCFVTEFDANSNNEMAKAMLQMRQIATDMKASICIIHHFSKGNNATKRVTDRGAGAGSMSRFCDGWVTIVEDKDKFSIDAAVRSFPRFQTKTIKRVGIHWEVSTEPEAELTVIQQMLGNESKTIKQIDSNIIGKDEKTIRRWLEDAQKQGWVDSCVDSNYKGRGKKPLQYFLTSKCRISELGTNGELGTNANVPNSKEVS